MAGDWAFLKACEVECIPPVTPDLQDARVHIVWQLVDADDSGLRRRLHDQRAVFLRNSKWTAQCPVTASCPVTVANLTPSILLAEWFVVLFRSLKELWG